MSERDPCLVLAEKTGFVDYLCGFTDTTLLDFTLYVTPPGVNALRAAADHGEALVNQAHLDAGSRFVTARMTMKALQRLDADGAVAAVELSEQLRHQRSQRQAGPQSAPPPGATPARVSPRSATLAAIIDDGCPFAHTEFRASGGRTRVVTLWDMDPDPELDFPESRPPAGFFRGREVPGKVLDQWMAAHTTNAVDESACYADARYRTLDVDLTHGSHLLGRLAGASYSRHPGPDEAAASDIAFVQLPRRELEAPGSGSIHASILDALRYLQRFAATNCYKQCVVVCAHGSLLGPHDGSSLFEQALDELLQKSDPPLRIVFAAGNGYEDGVHVELSPSSGQPASVAWMLPRDNEVATFAELWIDRPEGAVKVSVDLPDGRHELVDGQVVASSPPWLTAVRTGSRVTLRAAPTQVSDGTTPAPAGPVQIVAESTSGAVVHGYVCWGGKNLGYVRETRQAEWRVPFGATNAKLTGAGTLMGDACGADKAIHVAGGYVGSNGPQHLARASYSAIGPTRGGRKGPDCLAMSDANAATRGIPGPGTRTGITRWVWGTSVAAPQLARALINGEPPPANAGALPVEEVGSGFLPP